MCHLDCIIFHIMTDDVAGKPFTLEDLEISQIDKLATLPNIDNVTICKCSSRFYCCLRKSGRNVCPCKSMGKYCSSVCHGDDFETCMNRQTVQESNSDDSDVTTVSFVSLCTIAQTTNFSTVVCLCKSLPYIGSYGCHPN